MVIEELFAKIGFKVDRESLARANKALSSVREGAGRIVSAIKPLHAALLGTAGALGIGGLAKAALNASMQMESLRTQFGVLLQDMNAGAALFEKVHAMAVATPFDDKSLSKATSTLLAYGVAGDKVMETLTMLGDVAGADNTKLQYLALVYGQVMNAGRLKGDDLRQMVNWGVNPLGIIAEKRGISYAEATDLMSKRMISAEEVADAFRTMTSEGGRFYKSTEKMAQTLQGRWNQFKGTMFNVAATIGNHLAPAVKTVLQALTQASNDSVVIDLTRELGYFANIVAKRFSEELLKLPVTIDRVKQSFKDVLDTIVKVLKAIRLISPLIVSAFIAAFGPKMALMIRTGMLAALTSLHTSLRNIKAALIILSRNADRTFIKMTKGVLGMVTILGTAVALVMQLKEWSDEDAKRTFRKMEIDDYKSGKTAMENMVGTTPEALLRALNKDVRKTKSAYDKAAYEGAGDIDKARAAYKEAADKYAYYKALHYEAYGLHWQPRTKTPDITKTISDLRSDIKEQTAATEAQTKATKEQTKAITAISYGKSAFDAKFNVRLKEMVTAAYST